MHLLWYLSLAITSMVFTTPHFRSIINSLRTTKAASASTSNPTMAAMNANPTTSPPLSPTDFRIYNRLAEQMDYYHSLLRSNWDELYAGTAPGKKKPSPSQLIRHGLHFCQHLKGHHDIEETMWYPVLGKRMEAWRPGHFATEQHKQIHKGLDVMQPYLEDCQSGKKELVRSELRKIMDSFADVLWTHLDEEVQELGAESMRKHWTKEEMRRFPF